MACHFPGDLRLSAFCPDCGHVLLAHREDKQCSACQVVTATVLLPGARVLLQIPEDVQEEQARSVLAQLHSRFPDVDFMILADGAEVIGVQEPTWGNGSWPAPTQEIEVVK